MDELIDVLLNEDSAILTSFARALKYSEKLKETPKEDESNG